MARPKRDDEYRTEADVAAADVAGTEDTEPPAPAPEPEQAPAADDARDPRRDPGDYVR